MIEKPVPSDHHSIGVINKLKRSDLLIISDTPMYLENGKYSALGPVVRELEVLKSIFNSIVWIGFRRKDLKEDLSFQHLNSADIKLILLPKAGGRRILDKAKALLIFPYYLLVILRQVLKHRFIHTRAPSLPAFIGILLSFVFKRYWWHKYAGNWGQENPPLFYKVQKYFLILSKHSKVTINGKWDFQPKHCYSFENPCLDSNERAVGLELISSKKIEMPLVACFIGRIETAKGVGRILDAIGSIRNGIINEMHFIGDGSGRTSFEKRASELDYNIKFHGSISRTRVAEILIKADIFILPTTASEGFPKVIAEAWNYGCVPVVSNISSIPQYVDNSNGYVWNINECSFPHYFSKIQFRRNKLKSKMELGYFAADNFTFDHYKSRIMKEIFNDQSSS